MSQSEARSPLDLVGLLAVDEFADLGSQVVHQEIHTRQGCIISLWHGTAKATSGTAESASDTAKTASSPAKAASGTAKAASSTADSNPANPTNPNNPANPANPTNYVLAVGGANGGLLGPSGGLYPELATSLAEAGLAFVRIHFRRPGKPEECLLDVASVVELAVRQGGKRFVFVGHSFGGAVAIQAGAVLSDSTSGVVALATQSAGCEVASRLGKIPLLLIHGGEDQVLDQQNSRLVATMAGPNAEVVIYPQANHGLMECKSELKVLLESKILNWFEAA